MRTCTAAEAPWWVCGGVQAPGGKVTLRPMMLLSGVLGSLYLYTSSSAGNGELEKECQHDGRASEALEELT